MSLLAWSDNSDGSVYVRWADGGPPIGSWLRVLYDEGRRRFEPLYPTEDMPDEDTLAELDDDMALREASEFIPVGPIRYVPRDTFLG